LDTLSLHDALPISSAADDARSPKRSIVAVLKRHRETHEIFPAKDFHFLQINFVKKHDNKT
jgi:hypothetical protein